MFRRIGKMLFSCSCCLILLTGCNPMSREISDGSENWENLLAELKEMPPNELPEHLDAEVSEYLKIDATIETYSELTEYAAPNVELSLHMYEQKETVNTLLKYLGNPEVAEWQEIVKDDEFYPDGTPVSLYQAILAHDSIEHANAVQARDFYFIVWNNGDSVFDTLFYDYYNFLGMRSLNRIEEYANDIDLSFATRDDVDTMLEKCMDELGVAYHPWEQHVCTPEDLKIRKEAYEEQNKDDEYYMSLLHTDIGEETGVYVRTFCQSYYDIPVIPYNVNSGEITGMAWYSRTYAYVTYGHNGIEEFWAGGALDYIDTKDTRELISFGDALEVFVNERSDSAIGEQHTLKRAGLYYLPQLTQVDGYIFEARPVWVFICDYAEPYEGQPRYMVIYDAVTGEKIL